MINYVENMTFAEMVDMSSIPAHALARRMHTNTETLEKVLSEAYESARESGKLIVDSDGISFDTGLASITLTKNTDFSSSFPCYLKFTMKDDYRERIFAQKITQLPESLDQVNLITKVMERLNQFVTGAEGEPSEELIARLKDGYLAARQAGAFTQHGAGFTFDTGIQTMRGEPIQAAIKPGIGIWTGTWGMNYVGYENIYTPGFFNSALKEFASLDDTYLTDIASLAKEEKWHFADEQGNPEILRNYISYTFYRLEKEDKICVNSTKDFAAFNTGLPSATYDDIYMCFKRKPGCDDQKWKYAGVCTAKGGSVWKKLIGAFNPLPAPARYFNRKEDVLFDMNKTIYTDAEHIIYDRLHRIPTAFLRPSFLGCERGIELLNSIDNGLAVVESYDELKGIVAENDEIFNDLRERLEQLVSKTVRIIRWNYRLAIPSYYPKGNNMSLLLPLDFMDTGKAQAALVVQMTESGNYMGHTLLNMRHAYLNARLISSQESSWLTA